jgi:hypothetical protein
VDPQRQQRCLNFLETPMNNNVVNFRPAAVTDQTTSKPEQADLNPVEKAFEEWRASAGRDDTIEVEVLGSIAWNSVDDQGRREMLQRALGAYASRVLEDRRHRERAGKPFNLADLIECVEYSYVGVLGDGSGMTTEDAAMTADDVIAQIPATEILAALRQALILAIPVALAQAVKRTARP